MQLAVRSFVVALVVLLLAPPLEAQDGERTETAAAAFTRGREAFERGDYVGARLGFEEAYALTESPAIRYNLGLVEQRVGNLERAAEHYRAYLRGGPSEEDAAIARARLAEVEAELTPPDPDPTPSEAVAVGDPDLPPAASTSGGGGPDLLPFGLTLGAGSLATATMFALAGGFWAGANDLYATLGTCAPTCPVAEVEATGIAQQIDATNGLLVAGIAAGVVTAGLSIALALTAGDGGQDTVSIHIGVGHVALAARVP